MSFVFGPLLLIGFLGYLYPHKRQQRLINQWAKALQLKEHGPAFQQLYQNINGFRLSQEARTNQDALEYTYGEIEWASFIALLSLTQLNHHSIFYDLGSGVGKAACACAMVFPIKKSCGVELFKPLHQAAIQQQQCLERVAKYKDRAQTLHFINDNFLNVNLDDATHIFINATALFGETWIALKQHLIQLKSNTTIITTSKQLASEHFHLIKKTTVQMSWGLVNAYIYKKT